MDALTNWPTAIRRSSSIFVLLLVASVVQVAYDSGIAQAEESAAWGNLRGRVIFDGEPPEPRQLAITKDSDIRTEPLFDESLLVHKENGGIANVVVYLRSPRKADLRIHPSYAESAKDRVALNFANLQVRPHMALLRTAQTLVWKNHDGVGHNQKVDVRANASLGALLVSGAQMENRFTQAEPIPVRVGCNIHPWEQAYLLIQDHPYMAKTDADGQFEIRHLPMGVLEFQFWHERTHYLKNIAFRQHETNEKGRLTIDLLAGDKDLGEAKLAATLFDNEAKEE